jgi:uncharacterized membrane protein YfcA
VIKRYLFRNIHWLLIIFVLINVIIGFTTFTYSKPDIIAIIFGIIGLLGVSYLAFHMEARKRRKQEEK